MELKRAAGPTNQMYDFFGDGVPLPDSQGSNESDVFMSELEDDIFIPSAREAQDAARSTLRKGIMAEIYADLNRASVGSTVAAQHGPNSSELENKLVKARQAGQVQVAEQYRHRIYILEQHAASQTQAQLAVNAALLCKSLIDSQELSGLEEATVDALGQIILGATELGQGNGSDYTRAYNYSMKQKREMLRLYKVGTRLGWMMLSILAHSGVFRTAMSSIDARAWEGLLADIGILSGSIEMFVKSRGLDWQRSLQANGLKIGPLTVEDVRNRYDFKFSHPHEFYLDSEGLPQELWADGIRHVNVEENFYDEAVFGHAKPANWPAGVPWPVNPTLLYPPEKPICPRCHRVRCMDCDVRDVLTNPLIEMIEFSGRGRGVRSLQFIPAGSVLAEYVGDIVPLDHRGDSVYPLSIGMSRIELGIISACHKGNWTRYINHSCNSNTHFIGFFTAGRYRTVVRSCAPIGPFDEITVDYGDGYWTNSHPCLCGTASCRFPPMKEKEKEIELMRKGNNSIVVH